MMCRRLGQPLSYCGGVESRYTRVDSDKDRTGIGVRLSAGAPAACPYRGLIPSDSESRV
jgi:hypothetical protein